MRDKDGVQLAEIVVAGIANASAGQDGLVEHDGLGKDVWHAFVASRYRQTVDAPHAREKPAL
jgi:hypothetical protein